MKRIISAILITVLFFSLISCGGNTSSSSSETDESTAVCLIVNKHSNAPAIDYSRFYDSVFNAAYDYGYVSAITVEGSPQVICDYQIKKQTKYIDGTKRRLIAADYTKQILSEIASAEASSPEADTLTAISMSADILQSKKVSKKIVCIADSLLSTEGLLNFSATNLLDESPGRIVEQLTERFAVPDLTGIQVTIFGMAQTCGSQTPLGTLNEHKLETIWRAIFEASGCSDMTIDRTPLGTTAPESKFYVSPVSVIADTLTFTEPEQITDETAKNDEKEKTVSETASDVHTESTAETLIPEVVRFDETSIRFQGNSDAFVDSAIALESLTPVAEILRENPELHVVLAGMTASVGGDGIELSLKRAEAVRNLLITSGVDESQIRCVGLGKTPNCLRVNDLDTNGDLIESNAKLNRAVFLFEENSETAKKLYVNLY